MQFGIETPNCIVVRPYSKKLVTSSSTKVTLSAHILGTANHRQAPKTVFLILFPSACAPPSFLQGLPLTAFYVPIIKKPSHRQAPKTVFFDSFSLSLCPPQLLAGTAPYSLVCGYSRKSVTSSTLKTTFSAIFSGGVRMPRSPLAGPLLGPVLESQGRFANSHQQNSSCMAAASLLAARGS
jgi:hypothetical protein